MEARTIFSVHILYKKKIGQKKSLFFLNISFDLCNTDLGAGVHRGGRTMALSPRQISRPQVDNSTEYLQNVCHQRNQGPQNTLVGPTWICCGQKLDPPVIFGFPSGQI